jgi:GNAT superfamily N-acetyltransferase
MRRTDWVREARINELRHCKVLAEIAEAHLALNAAGAMATFSEGVEWLCHASGLELDRLGVEAAPGYTPDDAAAVAAAVDYYRERGVPARVEIASLAPPTLLAALGEAGFAVEQFENVLAADLGSPEVDLETEPPDGVEIVRIDAGDAEAVRAHAAFSSRWFVPPDQEVSEAIINAAATALRHPRSIAHAAMCDGELVGACGMEVDEIEGVRIAALWGAAVGPGFRRRGVQRSLIAHRLRTAAEAGCELALIESSPGIPTERNAARAGFSLSYVRVCLVQTGGASQ